MVRCAHSQVQVTGLRQPRNRDAAARLFSIRLGAMSNDGELLLGLFSYVVCEVTSCLPTYTTTELMYHAIERLSREFMFGRTWLKAR